MPGAVHFDQVDTGGRFVLAGRMEAHGEGSDAEQLRRLGYAQELRRRMGAFSNFAIAFSTICILAGGITSFQLGLSAVGGAAAGVVWPIGVAFSLVVALCMAQVASAFPTAGGLYHWSAILGGNGWGWATAWLNLGGLVFVTAAVNVGTYQLFVAFVGPGLGLDPARLGTGAQMTGVALISVSHALLNHFGIRLTTLLTDFSGRLILVVAVVLTVAMLHAASGLHLARLVTFTDYGGAAGGSVWPSARGVPVMTLLTLTWPIYTVTGFDASAHTAEETVQAAHNVPRGMLRSVLLSGLLGWGMVAAFVLALPDVAAGARQGGDVFGWLMRRVLPGPLGRALWVAIVAANYLCGLACMTSTSRMMYAFARDGGLPASGLLRRVSPRWQTPVPAIWTTAGLALASTSYAPAYSTLTTACVIFLYLSYVMPTAAGLRAYGRSWTTFGPFDLGGAMYRGLGAIALAGTVVLVWIGVQPPNQRALGATVVALGLLLATWWLGVRRRFRGPPR
ncbi:MAG TPA: amino acid permease [Polyangia bacterium]|nr:amino acid permease [Polyangia bacterium]